MTGHDVFFEAHHADDYTEDIALVVLCSCGAVLVEAQDYRAPQVGLDEAVDAAWAHRDAQERECPGCNHRGLPHV